MIKLNKKGFTLVELLAVIVILALLMVVATRTIGGALAESKAKAMQTEISKVVAKTYEEANSEVLLKGQVTNSTKFSYGTYSSKKIAGEEGNYSYYVTISDVSGDPIKISEFCIVDKGSGDGYKGSDEIINGNSVQFGEDSDYNINNDKTACN